MAGSRQYIRLRIDLVSGDSRDFRDKNIYRIVDIASNQPLTKLHKILFEHFDRFDPHMWRFTFGTEKYYSKEGTHYTDSICLEDELEYETEERILNADETRIGDLGLVPGVTFLYLFDYGDDWKHKITVLSCRDADKYERKTWKLVEKVGESPEQYAPHE